MIPPELRDQLYLGFRSSLHGFILAWNNNYVWKTQLFSFWSLLISTITVYCILYISLLPFRVLLWIFSFYTVVNLETLNYLRDVSSPSNLFIHLCWFIPLLAVFIMNNLLGYENIFFSVLSSIHPQFATQLYAKPRQRFLTLLYYFLRRTTLLFSFVMFIHLLRSSSYLGRFIPALWLLNYVRHTIINTKCLSVRLILITLILLVGYIKRFQPYAMSLLHLQLASIALARELFDTYLSRIHNQLSTPNTNAVKLLGIYPGPTTLTFCGFSLSTSIVTSKSVLNPHKNVRKFLRNHYLSLLTFALPYVFLLSVPLLGFFCVGFAHGAAAYTLVIIMENEMMKKQKQ
ncbi:unnamed protein product [Didymodactylos carnosus]|uniref:Uncharacterized protein n=1 Tax=Didymodactylos carnosus TaxID=1234261 RepID=A0A814GFV1_9BILA|nr:unnamed protein product [Didymodactylos carnosus]CAF1080908.1 unnamed protein product [Didymodactylos carnosus]CAF3767428.1 unnamed protein product [Didymodactylos carnosus]CAF3843905.1 unnamed protein product [Didymodactylos carnosus]